jgi:hypothetical protein
MKLTSWACAGLLLIAASCIGDLGAAEPRIARVAQTSPAALSVA